MRFKAYCLGGSQNGVKVHMPINHFISPADESYVMCEIWMHNGRSYPAPQNYWRMSCMSIQEATALANKYQPMPTDTSMARRPRTIHLVNKAEPHYDLARSDDWTAQWTMGV